MKKRTVNILIHILSLFFISFGALWGLYAYGYRINLTSSMPVGIWLLHDDVTAVIGDAVFFELPEPVASFGRQRGYVPRGKSPGETVPLFKTVIAKAGDSYSFNDDILFINGNPTLYCRKRVDTKGRSLPAIGSGTIPEHHVFLISGHTYSFDSRYFGPISKKNIFGVVKKVWTSDTL